MPGLERTPPSPRRSRRLKQLQLSGDGEAEDTEVEMGTQSDGSEDEEYHETSPIPPALRVSSGEDSDQTQTGVKTTTDRMGEGSSPGGTPRAGLVELASRARPPPPLDSAAPAGPTEDYESSRGPTAEDTGPRNPEEANGTVTALVAALLAACRRAGLSIPGVNALDRIEEPPSSRDRNGNLQHNNHRDQSTGLNRESIVTRGAGVTGRSNNGDVESGRVRKSVDMRGWSGESESESPVEAGPPPAPPRTAAASAKQGSAALATTRATTTPLASGTRAGHREGPGPANFGHQRAGAGSRDVRSLGASGDSGRRPTAGRASSSRDTSPRARHAPDMAQSVGWENPVELFQRSQQYVPGKGRGGITTIPDPRRRTSGGVPIHNSDESSDEEVTKAGGVTFGRRKNVDGGDPDPRRPVVLPMDMLALLAEYEECITAVKRRASVKAYGGMALFMSRDTKVKLQTGHVEVHRKKEHYERSRDTPQWKREILLSELQEEIYDQLFNAERAFHGVRQAEGRYRSQIPIAGGTRARTPSILARKNQGGPLVNGKALSRCAVQGCVRSISSGNEDYPDQQRGRGRKRVNFEGGEYTHLLFSSPEPPRTQSVGRTGGRPSSPGRRSESSSPVPKGKKNKNRSRSSRRKKTPPPTKRSSSAKRSSARTRSPSESDSQSEPDDTTEDESSCSQSETEGDTDTSEGGRRGRFVSTAWTNLEMFNGYDAEAYLAKFERHLRLERISPTKDDKKCADLLVNKLKGDSLTFYYFKRPKTQQSYKRLKKALISRFRLPARGNTNAWTLNKQEKGERVEKFAARIMKEQRAQTKEEDLTSAAEKKRLRQTFIAGMDDKVRTQVGTCKDLLAYKTIDGLIEDAKDAEAMIYSFQKLRSGGAALAEEESEEEQPRPRNNQRGRGDRNQNNRNQNNRSQSNRNRPRNPSKGGAPARKERAESEGSASRDGSPEVPTPRRSDPPICYKCWQVGHKVPECPNPRADPPPGRESQGRQRDPGNPSGDKPRARSTSRRPPDASSKCYNCSQLGHYARECPNPSTRAGPSKGGPAKDHNKDNMPTPVKRGVDVDDTGGTAGMVESAVGLQDIRAHLPIQVNGCSMTAVLDSGAVATLIDEELALTVTDEDDWVESSRVFTSASRQKMPVTASCPVVITIGSQKVRQVVFVCRGLGNRVILGYDFMLATRCNLSCYPKRVTFNGEEVEIADLDTRSDPVPWVATSLREVKVAPHTVRNLNIPIPNARMEEIREGDLVLVEPTEIPEEENSDLELEYEGEPFEAATRTPLRAWVPSCLSRAMNGYVRVPVVNPYDEIAWAGGAEPLFTLKRFDGDHVSIGDVSPGVPRDDGDEETDAEAKDPDLGPRAYMAFLQRLKRYMQQAKRGGDLLPEPAGVSLRDSDMTTEEIELFRAMLSMVSSVFAETDSDLGQTDLVRHTITTTDGLPIRQRPYRTALHYRKEMEELLDQMLEQGVIEPSNSPWASPVVLVKKHDGKLRFCVDYRKLNAISRKDSYPLPRIDEVLDSLGGAKYFSTLDLQSGFWQIELENEAKAKTAFTCHRGLFQFRQMPFGLTNAPATFQRLMDCVLTGLSGLTCLVFIDDIIIFTGADVQRHMFDVYTVLKLLSTVGLKVKGRKCEFAKKELRFLGHLVTQQGISPDPEKLATIEQCLPPTDLTGIRSFLGLAGYYRKFVPGFAKIAAHFVKLTKKRVPYVWSEQCQEAFLALKQKLMEEPVLIFPDLEKPFEVYTDASGEGIGAILSQKDDEGNARVVAYMSRGLKSYEKNYAVTDLELLAVVHALLHFRTYLLGKKFTIITDHQANTWTLNKKQTETGCQRRVRWALLLQEYDYDVVYKAGRTHANADAVSRPPFVQSDEAPRYKYEPAEWNPDKEQTTEAICFDLREETQVKTVERAMGPHGVSEEMEDALDRVFTADPSRELCSLPNVDEGTGSICPVDNWDDFPPEEDDENSPPHKRPKARKVSKKTKKKPRRISRRRREWENKMWILQTSLVPPQSGGSTTGDSELEILDEVPGVPAAQTARPGLRSSRKTKSQKAIPPPSYKEEDSASENSALAGTAPPDSSGAGEVGALEDAIVDEADVPELGREITVNDADDDQEEEEEQDGDAPSITTFVNKIDEEIKKEQREDPFSAPIIQLLEERILPEEPDEAKHLMYLVREFFLYKDLLYHIPAPKGKQSAERPEPPKTRGVEQLVINSARARHSLEKLHSGPLAAHLGHQKLHDTLSRDFYWPNSYAEVKEFCKNCEICQLYNPGGSRKVRLHPLEPVAPFHRIQMDFEGPLAKTANGNRWILVIIDTFTKYPIAVPVPDVSTETAVRVLVEEVISHHGCPVEILRDNGAGFVAALYQETCKALGIVLRYSAPHHHQTVGQVERFNKTLQQMLSKKVAGRDPRTWEEYLPAVLFAYRTTVHATTKETPAYALYGRDLVTPVDLLARPLEDLDPWVNPENPKDMEEYRKMAHRRLQVGHDMVRQNTLRAQETMASYFNRNIKEGRLAVGDVVTRQCWVQTQKRPKLAQLYYGTYRIIEFQKSNALLHPLGRTDGHREAVPMDQLKKYHGYHRGPMDGALPKLRRYYRLPGDQQDRCAGCLKTGGDSWHLCETCVRWHHTECAIQGQPPAAHEPWHCNPCILIREGGDPDDPDSEQEEGAEGGEVPSASRLPTELPIGVTATQHHVPISPDLFAREDDAGRIILDPRVGRGKRLCEDLETYLTTQSDVEEDAEIAPPVEEHLYARDLGEVTRELPDLLRLFHKSTLGQQRELITQMQRSARKLAVPKQGTRVTERGREFSGSPPPDWRGKGPADRTYPGQSRLSLRKGKGKREKKKSPSLLHDSEESDPELGGGQPQPTDL